MAGLVSLQPKVTASLSPTGVSRFGGPLQVQIPAQASFSSVFVGKVLVRNDVVSVRIGQRKSGKFVVRMNWNGPRISTMGEVICEQLDINSLMLEKLSVQVAGIHEIELLIDKTEQQLEEMLRNTKHEAVDAAVAKRWLLKRQVQGEYQGLHQEMEKLQMNLQWLLKQQLQDELPIEGIHQQIEGAHQMLQMKMQWVQKRLEGNQKQLMKMTQLMLEDVSVKMEGLQMKMEGLQVKIHELDLELELELKIEKKELRFEEMRKNGKHEAVDASAEKLWLLKQEGVHGELQGLHQVIEKLQMSLQWLLKQQLQGELQIEGIHQQIEGIHQQLLMKMQWVQERLEGNEKLVMKMALLLLEEQLVTIEGLQMNIHELELKIEKNELGFEEMRRNGKHEAADAGAAELRLIKQRIQGELQGLHQITEKLQMDLQLVLKQQLQGELQIEEGIHQQIEGMHQKLLMKMHWVQERLEGK